MGDGKLNILNKLTWLFLVFYFAVPKVVCAQYTEYEVKAAYLEKFSRFIEWPPYSALSDTSQPFIIGIVGNSPFDHMLEDIFEEYQIKSRKVEIKYYPHPAQITECNMLFIAASEKKNLEAIFAEIDDDPILTISDNEGFTVKGVHINMYMDGNYIRYEINPKAMKKSGLKVSSLLLNSAKIIHTDD